MVSNTKQRPETEVVEPEGQKIFTSYRAWSIYGVTFMVFFAQTHPSREKCKNPKTETEVVDPEVGQILANAP